MLNMSLPWWEFVIRALVVYLFLVIGIRLTGRRQVGQLSPLDFILLLILSNSVQNSMNGGDNSLVGGMILAGTLLAMNWFFSYITFRSQRLASSIDGRPLVLIHEGKINESVKRLELITDDELKAIIRRNGLENVGQVHIAIIEPNGSISVIAKK